MVAIQSVGLTILTVGHSNHSAETFLRLIRRQRVEMIVDVRSQPYSQYSPQFNHEELARLLGESGIEYVFAGDTLGGRPRGAEYYDTDGRVLYYKVARSEFFELGVSRLKFLAGGDAPLAIMCSEEDPVNCHRRLLVGRVLAEHDIAVRHLRGDGRVQEEAELGGAQKASSPVQRGLFDSSEESSWKSIRSVLPARPPRSSSSH